MTRTRRALLTGMATAGIASLAGCSSVGQRPLTTHVTTDPSVGETHIHFRDGDTEVAVATFRVESPADGSARVGAYLTHRFHRVEDYRLRFRVVTPEGHPTQVAFRRPAAALPAFVFRPADEHDWTEFRVDDLGEHGIGALHFGFDVLTTEPTDRFTLFVDLRATLADKYGLRSRVVQAVAEAESRQVRTTDA